MEWKKDGQEKPKIWPYQVQDQHCAIKLSATLLKGEETIDAYIGSNAVFSEDESSAAPIDISKYADTDWNILRLEIDLSLRGGVDTLEAVVAPENLDNAFFSVRFHAPKSKYRKQVWGSPAKNCEDSIILKVPKDQIGGEIFLRPEVLLRQNVPMVDGKASRAGSRIVIGDPVVIAVDEPPLAPGAGFDIKWQDFPKESKNALYKLEFEHPETGRPRLHFNNRHPEIQPIIDTNGRRGLKVRIRDVIFSAVAVDVWSELIQWAAERDEGDNSSGIHANILKAAAKLTRMKIDDIKNDIIYSDGRRNIQVALQDSFVLAEKVSRAAEEESSRGE